MISSSLHIHNDAVGDLRAIAAADPVAAGRLAALLQQLKVDPALQDKLLTHDYGADRTSADISVKKWGSMRTLDRLPVWRLRAWILEREGLSYRIFYIFDWKNKSFEVLGISQRDGFNYDDTQHPLRVRMAGRIRRDFPGI